MNKKLRTTLIFVFGIILLLVIGYLIIKSRTGKSGNVPPVKYTLEKDGREIDVSESGLTKFTFGNDSFMQNWDNDTIKSLYDYIRSKGAKNMIFLTKGNYIVVVVNEGGRKITYYLSADDPKMKEIFDTFNSGGGDNGGGGNGGGGGDIFHFGSPAPTSIGGVPTPQNTTPGGIEMPKDCPLWLLSICIWPRKPAPTIQPKTPAPSVIPDCSYWLKDVQDRAIISNTLCMKPTPTPTPLQ